MESQERLEPIAFIILVLCTAVGVFFYRKFWIFFYFFHLPDKFARVSAELAKDKSPLEVELAKEAQAKQRAKERAEKQAAEAKANWAKANPEAAKAEAEAETARAKAEAEAILGPAKDQ